MKFNFSSVLRYLFLLIFGLFGLDIIYFIFTPITSIPSFLIIKLIYPEAVIEGLTQIWVNGDNIVLIEACIAGAAYYFLLILNMTTPMSIAKRLKSILFLFAAFLGANIIRIIIFSYMYVENFRLFEFYHLATWYLVSTLFVVVIWFVNVRLFNITQVPIYSDFSALFNDIKPKKRNN